MSMDIVTLPEWLCTCSVDREGADGVNELAADVARQTPHPTGDHSAAATSASWRMRMA